MSVVHYEIAVGEANAAFRAFSRRWAMGRWSMLAGAVIGLVSVVVGEIIAQLAAGPLRLSDGVSEVAAIGIALALAGAVGLPAWRAICMRRYRSRLSRHGMRGPLQASCRCTDDALIYSVGGMEKAALWTVVSEVFRFREWWVLAVQGEGFYLPRRAFGSVQAERDFIACVLEHVDEEARRRSAAASRFSAAAQP